MTTIATNAHDCCVSHLGIAEKDFAATFTSTGSLIDAIEHHRGAGRTLELLDLVKPGPLDTFIADNELLDPDHPDDFLKPIMERSLWKSWRKERYWQQSGNDQAHA